MVQVIGCSDADFPDFFSRLLLNALKSFTNWNERHQSSLNRDPTHPGPLQDTSSVKIWLYVTQ